jgi:hypothetical protein
MWGPGHHIMLTFVWVVQWLYLQVSLWNWIQIVLSQVSLSWVSCRGQVGCSSAAIWANDFSWLWKQSSATPGLHPWHILEWSHQSALRAEEYGDSRLELRRWCTASFKRSSKEKLLPLLTTRGISPLPRPYFILFFILSCDFGILIKCTAHKIDHLNHFQVCSLVALNTLMLLCHHHHRHPLAPFSSKLEAGIQQATPPMSSPLALAATTPFLSLCTDYSRHPCRWDHPVSVFLWLVYFMALACFILQPQNTLKNNMFPSPKFLFCHSS